MNKQIFTALLLIGCFFSQAQETTFKERPIYVDTVAPYIVANNTPIGLGLMIGDNQKFHKKYNPDVLITPPTIVRSEKNSKGELEIDAFVNTDHINVIVNGITAENVANYKAFSKISEQGHEIEHQIVVSKHNPAIISDENINQTKAWLYGRTFFYEIRDRANKTISTLKLKFIVPKPEPRVISIDKKLIEASKERPGESFDFEPEVINNFKKQLSSENLVNTKFDSLSNVPKQLVLPFNTNSFLLSFKELVLGVDLYLEYKLDNDSTWKTTAKNRRPTIIFDGLSVGKHKLTVRYSWHSAPIWEYEFEIKPHWTQTTLSKVVLGIVIATFVSWILFRRHNKKQKAKLDQERAQRKLVQNQIQALRSQLDPHFIFNALSSIQSLINRNNIEAANLYISKFGALLHQILEKGDVMMHPLAIEMKQVEHYLQLEQLRFKFDYGITVDDRINTSEIDIPIMLLQPYIENAIKHGIIEMGENGKIELTIVKIEDDMIVSIKDNGKGYDVLKNKQGHGNTLVAERISMLNSLLTDQQINVQPLSVIGEGTSVTIHFTNWL